VTQTIGILGVGHFGGYLVEGLMRAQGLRVILSPRGAAKAQGLPHRPARDIVAWCFRGAGTMRLHDIKESLPDIVASLATPGGLTERGLNSLRSEDGIAAWGRAMDAQLRKVRGQDK